MATPGAEKAEGQYVKIEEKVEIFLRFAKAGDADKCVEAIRADASLLNCVEAGGFAALHFAAAHGHATLLAALVELKANLEIESLDHNTPLMLAARSHQNDAATALLRAGADANKASPTGATALHHAAYMGHVDTMRLLVAQGGAKAVVDAPLESGSVLHWAVDGKENAKERLATIGYCLYELHVPINVADKHGGTALFQLLHGPNRDAEFVQFLLDHGADAKVTAIGNTTPLHLAVTMCSLDVVKMLLEAGADPEAKDKDGDTPLSAAEAEGAKKKNFVSELKKWAPGGANHLAGAMSAADVAAKKAEDAKRFKEHGNRVFADGENNKAAKLYSRAIALEPSNHVYFSNRSACNFNTLQYTAALYDAKRCIALKPDWPKGYFRLASALKALRQLDEAQAVCNQGLALDKNNADIKKLVGELATQMGKK